jgi:uncharacterized protein (TIGR01244 family)
MNNLRMVTIILLCICFVPVAVQAKPFQSATVPPQRQPGSPLPNYVELTSKVGTGGQPGEGGLNQLAKKGYKVVVNVRASDEEFDRVGEENLAMQLGLRYYVVPFLAREPSEQQALAFNALMSALKGNKVFVHCGSGNRAGSLMMIYLALEEGMSEDKAEQEARKIGLRSADLVEFSKQVIGKHRK